MSTHVIPTPSASPDSKPKYELMPPGEHDLEVVLATDVDGDGAPLVTRAGDPRIKMKVMNDSEQSFFHFLYLNDKAIPLVWEFLTACGVSPDGETFELDPLLLEGRRFRATVYEQDGWNRLRKPRPIPSDVQPTPDPETTEPEILDEDVPF